MALFEDGTGREISFPVAVDVGEAKKIVVRFPVEITRSHAERIKQLLQRADPDQKMDNEELQRNLLNIGFNLVGDRTRSLFLGDGDVIAWDTVGRPTILHAALEFETGRARKFGTTLSWPQRSSTGVRRAGGYIVRDPPDSILRWFRRGSPNLIPDEPQ
jgi:hypothetical protein